MRFFLQVVNYKTAEAHPDKEFASMDDLLKYVAEEEGLDWTSLLVVVQPGK